jgi:hypothetical protein
MPARDGRSWRPSGTLVFAGVTALGLGAGVLLYQAQRSGLGGLSAREGGAPIDPAAAAELARTTGDDPPEERLAFWLERYGTAQIHRSLFDLRVNDAQPWIVAYTVAVDEPAADPAVWGVDLTELAPARTLLPGVLELEGLTLTVHLPAPRLIARARLLGDGALSVPRYRPGDPLPDAALRVRELAEATLARVFAEPERKIPGARLVLVLGD